MSRRTSAGRSRRSASSSPVPFGQADDAVPLEREQGGEELEVVGLVFDDHDRRH